MTSNIGAPIPEKHVFGQIDVEIRAEARTPGLLDSIVFAEEARPSEALPDDFVEVEAKVCDLNFRDVMPALGHIEPYPVDCECAGIIIATGRLAHDLHPNNPVVVNAKKGCIRNTLRVSVEEVEFVPNTIWLEIAAALPVAS